MTPEMSLTKKELTNKLADPMACSELHSMNLLDRHLDSSYSFNNSVKEMSPNHQPNHTIAWDDFSIGRFVGSGAFCCVYSASLHMSTKNDDDYSEADVGCVIKMIRTMKKTGTGMATSDDSDDQEAAEWALMDLLNEASFLSSLSHKNIIRFHGTTCHPLTGRTCLILDRLVDTLDQRFTKWRMESKSKGFFIKNSISRDDVKDRLSNVAVGLADGLEYLHKQGIVHRDLKPQNIGFDDFDNPVIFDFGLARRTTTQTEQSFVLPDSFNASTISFAFSDDELSGDDGNFVDPTELLIESTGIAGTPRYMAPEIALGLSYGVSADVYSFAIILWELCTLKRAFHARGSNKSSPTVFGQEGQRPSSKSLVDCPSLKSLLRSTWSQSEEKRPPMTWVKIELNQVIQDLSAPTPPVPTSRPHRSLLRRNSLSSCFNVDRGMVSTVGPSSPCSRTGAYGFGYVGERERTLGLPDKFGILKRGTGSTKDNTNDENADHGVSSPRATFPKDFLRHRRSSF